MVAEDEMNTVEPGAGAGGQAVPGWGGVDHRAGWSPLLPGLSHLCHNTLGEKRTDPAQPSSAEEEPEAAVLALHGAGGGWGQGSGAGRAGVVQGRGWILPLSSGPSWGCQQRAQSPVWGKAALLSPADWLWSQQCQILGEAWNLALL